MVDFSKPGLLISDVDNTITDSEAINLLADYAGKGAEVAKITAEAMNGCLDFSHSLAQRVAFLEGLDAAEIISCLLNTRINEGVFELIERLRAKNWRIALASGGFTQIVEPLSKALNCEEFLANELEIVDDKLTGKVLGEIVDAEAKGSFLVKLCEKYGIPLENTIAIGDGSNDLKMLEIANIGFAYCSKPSVKERVLAMPNGHVVESFAKIIQILSL